MKKSTKKGFTLVELVIVIAVIAILSAILIPTFGNVISNANETKYRSGAKAGYEEMLTAQLQDHPEVGEMKALVIYKEGEKITRAYDAANGEMKDAKETETYGNVKVTYTNKNAVVKNGETEIAYSTESKLTKDTTTVALGTAYYVTDNVYVVFYEEATTTTNP